MGNRSFVDVVVVVTSALRLSREVTVVVIVTTATSFDDKVAGSIHDSVVMSSLEAQAVKFMNADPTLM